MQTTPTTPTQQAVLASVYTALAAGDPQAVCAAMAGVLSGPQPAALAVPLQQGRLESFGFHPQTGEALAALQAVPAVPLLRWWAFLHCTGGYLPRVMRAFGWSEVLRNRLAQLDAWYCSGMPASRTTLKRRLQWRLPVEPQQAFAAFAALDPAFAALPQQYQALLASGEPFCVEQLRINAVELALEGVPARKADKVLQGLLVAVIETPALNSYPVLAEMARALCRK